MQGDQIGKRPKRLRDVPIRFPPPPGTRFYVCFTPDLSQKFPPCHEWPTVIADCLEEAIEQVIREGLGPTNPEQRCAQIVWFDHNGNARCRYCWLTADLQIPS